MRLHGPQETGFISVTDVSRAKFPVLIKYAWDVIKIR